MQGERVKVAGRYIKAVCSIKGKCDASLLTFFDLLSPNIINQHNVSEQRSSET
jgi:hypothetical protein